MTIDRLHDVIERLTILLRADTRRHGKETLQPIQRAALEYLARCNHLSDTPAAVTEFLLLTKGTVSQTLGVLVRRRLIEKRRDGQDRRVVHLSLTPAGRRVVANRSRVWRQACAALDEKQIARTESLLGNVVRAAERASAARSFGDCQSCGLLRNTADGRQRCGFSNEMLAAADIRKICREHVSRNDRSRSERA